jgi:hypothetical protein
VIIWFKELTVKSQKPLLSLLTRPIPQKNS